MEDEELLTTPQQQPEPPTDVVGALREFYAGLGQPARDEDLEATAKAYAGKEADMWRNVMDAQNFDYTEEDIDYVTATYDNPYSLQKKKAGGNGSPSSGGQGSGQSNAPTAEDGTPSSESGGSNVPMVVPLSKEQNTINYFLDQGLYGTSNRDYDGLEVEAYKSYVLKTDAGAILYQSGMITDKERFDRQLKLEEEYKLQQSLISAKKKAGLPLSEESLFPAEEVSPDNTRPELRSLYGQAGEYFGDLMPKIDAVYDLVTQQAPSVLGQNLEDADRTLQDITVRHQMWASGSNGDHTRGYTGNVGDGIYEGSRGALGDGSGLTRYRELQSQFPQYAVTADQAINTTSSPLNDALVDAAQPKLDKYFPDVPSVVTDKMRDVFLTMNPDFKPGDFAEVGNPLNMIAGDLADDFLDKSGLDLDDRERQAVRRRLEQIVRSSYRNKVVRDKVMSAASENGLRMPTASGIERADEEVRRMDVAITAQATELRDLADARISSMKSEYDLQAASFRAQVKMDTEALASSLQAAVQSGEMTEEQANENYAAFHAQRQEQANEMTREWSGRLANASKNFDRQRTALLSEFQDKQSEILAEAGFTVDGEGNMEVDMSSQEMINEMLRAQSGVMTSRDKRKAQEEYMSLSNGEKVARGLASGTADIFTGIGLSAEWLGATDFGYEYSRDWKSIQYNAPLRDFGDFDWKDMEDKDWWFSKAIPMLPLLGTLAATGGTGGLLGAASAETLGLGAFGTLAMTSTGAAVASRITEGMMESGQRYEKSLEMGKTPEEAKADGANIFKRNMYLIGLDAIQFASILKFADKVNTAANTASRFKTAASFTGGLTGNTLIEAGEEWWQGYSDYRIDNPTDAFLELGNVRDYLATPEGMEAGVLGGIFGAGFYVGGTASTTIAGYTASQTSQVDPSSDRDAESQITGRGRQLLATIALLNRRGVITEEQSTRLIRELVVATETNLAIERGDGRIDRDHSQRTQYVEMMATAAGLEVEAAREGITAEEKANMEREASALRDKMQEIEQHSPDIANFSLDGIPVAAENLAAVFSDPELASQVSASSVEMSGNPLEVVATARAAASMEAGVNDDLRSRGEQAVTDAIIELANDPELAGDYTSLEARANNAMATGEKAYAEKWGYVSEAIAAARAGEAYPALQQVMNSQPSTQQMNSTAAAREGVEDARMDQTTAPSPDTAASNLQEHKMRRSREITNDFFNSMFDVRDVIMAVKDKFPNLASSIERATSADEISEQDKAKFVRAALAAQRSGEVNIREAVQKARSNGQRNQANQTTQENNQTPTFDDPLGQAEQVGMAEANDPDALNQQRAVRSALSDKFILDNAMMSLLASRDAELHEAVQADPGMQSLTEQQVESLELIVSETAGNAVLQPSSMGEFATQKAAAEAVLNSQRSSQDLRDAINGNRPPSSPETMVEQAFMFGMEWGAIKRFFSGGNENMSESVEQYRSEQQKRVDTITLLTARALAFIKESAILRPSQGIVKYTDFMAVLRSELSADEMSKLDSDGTRSAFNRARRNYAMMSENPIEYNSVLTAKDRFIRWIADTRIGLRRFEQHLSRMGFDGKAALKEMQRIQRKRIEDQIELEGGDTMKKIYAREQARIGPGNPIPVGPQMSTQMRADIKALQEKIDARANRDQITMSVYNDIQGLQGRINYASSNLDKMVFGLKSGDIGAVKANKEAWVNKIYEHTGLQLDDVSLYFYAKHAIAFNERIRNISRERMQDRLKELNNKLAEAQAEYRLHTQNGDAKKAKLAAARVASWSDRLQDALSNEDSVAYEIEQGSGMSDADAAALLDHYNSKETNENYNGDMAQFMEEQYKWFKENVIDARIHIARDAGLISQEMAMNILEGKRPVYVRDANGDRVIGPDGQFEVDFEEGFTDYVPLRVNNEAYLDARDPSNEADAQGRGGTATILSAEGTVDFDVLKRNDPIAQAMADFNATIEMAERNKGYRTILEMARTMPDPSLWKVVPSSGMVTVNESGHIAGYNDFTSPFIKKNSVAVMVDGKIQYLFFQPERQVNRSSIDKLKKSLGISDGGVDESVMVPSSILTALTQPDKSKVGSAALVGVLRTYMNFKRGMTTQWNPIFGFKNITRDIATLIFNTSSTDTEVNQRDLRKSIYKNYAKSMAIVGKRGLKGFKSVNPDPMSVESLWAEAIEYGLPMSWSNYDSVSSREQKYKDVLASQGREGFDREGYGRTILRYAGRRMERLNDVMENTARLAAYASLRQNGVNIKDAVAASKDITVNFERHGNFTPILNTFWLFANAGVQDAYRSSRTFGSKKALKAAAGLFATYFMIGAFFSWLESLDDEGNKRTAFQRSNNLIFPTGTGIAGTIPKPYGQPRFWMNAGMYTQRMIDGRDRPRDAINGMFGDMIAMFDPVGASSENPVSALAPTMLQVPTQYAMNMNFMGGKMYNDFPGMETIDKAGRTPDYFVNGVRKTNNFLQQSLLGEFIPVPEIPPVLVYEMIRDFGGSVGGEGINIYNLFMGDTKNGKLASTPFARSFAIDMDAATGRAMSTIYEQNKMSAYHPPNERQVEEALKSYEDIVIENEKREDNGEKPLVKWTSLNYQRKLYMKFGVDLATGERWEVPEYRGYSPRELRDQEEQDE